MSQPNAAFGLLLRRHRLLAGLSQEELAERASISLNAVGSLERGVNRQPHPKTVSLLADALGLLAEPRAAFVFASRSDLDAESSQLSSASSQRLKSSAVAPIPANLPVSSTSFVGREREVAAIQEGLRKPGVRLLTLTGPGGVGKTRIALQVAAGLLPDFPDGVFVASLAAISDPSLVISKLAQVLGLKASGSDSQQEDVITFLRPRACLLVCDNFEQVLPAGPLLADLLAEAPRLKIMVTSRSVLHVQIEREFPVPPLALPEPRRLSGLPELGPGLIAYGAVRLFVERARDVRPDFALTNENARSVAEICLRLDGLPLAIELAAARIRVLPPAALLARLEHRLPLLTGGARDLPARQQTLRDAIAWSYDLLDPGEKSLFQRLAVFVGGCTLEAAEAVVGAGVNVLDGLESLVANSLLRLQDGLGGEPRFTWLETIREYAWELLARSGESASLRDRHTAWCLRLVETASPDFVPSQTAAGLDRLDEEYENLRAALHWLCESGDVEKALRFGARIAPLWWYRGYQAEAQIRLGALLALPAVSEHPSAAIRIYRAAGHIAFLQGDFATAELHLAKTIALSRDIGDRGELADALVFLGIYLRDQNDLARAAPHFEESLTIARELGHRGRAAQSLMQLGIVARQQGDLALARALLEESFAIDQDLGAPDMTMAAVTLNLGLVAEDDHDDVQASSCYQQCLVASCRSGYVYLIAFALEGFASLAAQAGQPTRALRLIGAAARLRQEKRIPLPPMMQERLDRALALARRQLAPESPDAAFAEGRGMTWREASAYALTAEADA